MVCRWIVFMLFLELFTLQVAFATVGGLRAEVQEEPINTDMVFLLIDKKSLRADLRTWPKDPKKSNLLMSFRIAIGKSEGDKQFEGDNKTPEGIYLAQKFIDTSGLPKKYGSTAIPINFPNPFDKHRGKTGHGIWLHGVDNSGRIGVEKVTEGCVAFYNKDIKKLSRWVQPYQSVVMIVDGQESVNHPKDISEIKNLTEKWLEAWKSKQEENYFSYYSEDFKLKGMKLPVFKQYKSRIFKNYKQMEVNTFDHRYFSNGKYAVAMMNQDFNGDNRYIANGRKILYWEKSEQGGWEIIREVYENRRLTFFTFRESEIFSHFKDSPSAKLFQISKKTWN